MHKFERKLATEMHDLFEDAFNKHGCNGYSDMTCTSQPGGDRLKCRIQKAIPMKEGPMCRPDLLQQSASHEVTKFVNKANRRFGCGVDEVVCKMDLDGWTKCSTSGKVTEFDYENGKNPRTCDTGLLRVDIEHEIYKELAASQRKFKCPKVKKVVCDRVKTYGEKHIHCRVSILDNARIPSTCDMHLLTQELSEDVGESLLKSEYKYKCYVPRRMVCWVGKDNRVDCNLSPVEQDTAYDPGAPDIDDHGWKEPIDDDFGTTAPIHDPYDNADVGKEEEEIVSPSDQPSADETVQKGNVDGTYYEEQEETNLSPAGKLRTFAAKYNLRGSNDGKKYFEGL